MAQFVKMIGQGAGQGTVPMPAGRMHNHARRFVDDSDRFVFEQNIEWNWLWLGAFTGHLKLLDQNKVALFELLGRLAGLTVDPNAARFDCPL